MKKRFFKKFNVENDYFSQKDEIMGKPHVASIIEPKQIIYCKVEYPKEYFTIQALKNGTVGIQIPDMATSLKYRRNDEPWIETSEAVQLTVQAFDTIQISSVSNSLSYACSSMFAISMPFNVKGNIMSLLYGDNFENQTTIENIYGIGSLFYNCTTLKSAKNLILPATTLADCCYYRMFYGCENLTTAPKLPATTLANNCYDDMFNGCTSLTTAPKLPATTLANGCYYYMFNGCTSLTTAPELPATTLASYCYYNMFQGCSNLNKITMLATDISADYCLSSWVDGVASSGTFVKHPDMTSLPNGVSGIPTGWIVKNYGENSKNYFRFIAVEDSSILLTSINVASGELDNTLDLQYSKDGSTWTQYEFNAIPLSAGETLYMKGNNPNGFSTMDWESGTGRGCIFGDLSGAGNGTTGKYECHGNIMSLLYGDDFEDKTIIPNNMCFGMLFMGCVGLLTAPELPATTLAERCYFNMFSSCTSLTAAPELPATTLAVQCYSGMFQGCTSLTSAPTELPATTLANSCYGTMFMGCTSLVNAPELPATTLTKSCYRGMFGNCTSLTAAPELPATTLTEECYHGMFISCSNLNYIKMLATDISADYCLDSWVYNVASSGTFVKHPDMTSLPSSINGIPEGWTVEDYSENSKNYFRFVAVEDSSILLTSVNGISGELDNTVDLQYSKDGTSWTQYDFNAIPLNAGETLYMKGNNPNGFSIIDMENWAMRACTFGDLLGAGNGTTGKYECHGNIMSLLYGDDFEDKTTIPNEYCFASLFMGCVGLLTAPELPATTLTENCYNSMFQGCTSLINAPELPATILASGCYSSMFGGCTSLVNAPELPATTLAEWCYNGMFEGCTSLVNAPELPAPTLASSCYSDMFQGCSNLNKITMLATDISADYCLSIWVNGVASSGTFVKHPDMTSLPSGHSGIPEGWTVQDYVDIKNYFHFVAVEDSSIALTLMMPEYEIEEPNNTVDLQYSKDGTSWTQYDFNAIPLNAGETLYMKGNNPNGFGPVYKFGGSTYGKYECHGNIMSLLYGDDFKDKTTIPSPECFGGLFMYCDGLLAAPELPATTLTENCYNSMFYGCTSLVNAPELPATTLADSCYNCMFYDCTSLVNAPELPATILASGCYSSMFGGCTSLVNAPELPAIILASSCYYSMFLGCTSLVNAPKLPAITLASSCYSDMFLGCTNLNKITMLATDISADNCLSFWVDGVASSGTFIKNVSMTSLPSGNSGIPEGWAVVDYTKNYFRFVAVEDSRIVLTTLPVVPDSPEGPSGDLGEPDLQYSKDGLTWTQYDFNIIPLSAGETLYMKGNNTYTFGTTFGGSTTGKYECHGNIMSLLYGDDFEDKTTIPSPGCFASLFFGCRGLLTAPELPATTLSNFCYQNMFTSCHSLVNAPELPATTLANNCYEYMFYICDSLTTAPQLLATTLVNNCYNHMFDLCSNLNYITMLATDISATNCLSYWVNGVASSGTFVKHPDMASLPSGTSGIPEGWTVQDYVDIKNYFRFIAVEDSSILLTSINVASGELDNTLDLQYSKDGSTWTQYDFNAIPLSARETLYMKGNNPNGFSTMDWESGTGRGCIFGDISGAGNGTTGKYECHGNIMSLLYGDDFEDKTIIPNNMCFGGLFNGCVGLLTAPELPATTLTMACYNTMFASCTSLTTAPELPATTLASGCYSSMFYDCTSLVNAPELSATTLVDGCYESMFQGCTSLTTAPELPATTLADYCYNSMFQGCSNLTTAPELPATTLASYCYFGMFRACTSLTTAPELPATTLADSCYNSMFSDCTNLNNITMLATDISASDCLMYWVTRVSSTGTFIKNAAMTSLSSGNSGIPKGWAVVDDIKNYFRFVAVEDSSIVLTALPVVPLGLDPDSPDGPDGPSGDLGEPLNPIDLQYSKDGTSWTQYDFNVIPLSAGETLYMKGNNGNNTYSFGTTFGSSTTGKYECHGNIMSLLYGDDFENKTTIPIPMCFASLFNGCHGLLTAPELPATTLSNFCYQKMFSNCTSLVNAPELPATTLADSCYSGMFYGCDSLTTAPQLHATTLASYCYYNMFQGCSNLTTVPQLPATTLASSCYAYMFRDCESLAAAPALPATTLASSCYENMFRSCRNLTTAPELPATTLASNCYSNMFDGCSNLTTAPELPATTLASSCYKNMFYYCTSLTTAPQLLATTLVNNCYDSMFLGCSNLNYITMLATDISATNCLYYWVNGVASSGTFVKHPQASLPSGVSGIPNGWTVQNYEN